MHDKNLRVLVVPSLLSSFLCRESARVREKERERAREESAREREREHTRTRSRTSCTGASRALADGCHPPLWIAPALGYSCSAKTRKGYTRRLELSTGSQHIAVSLRTGTANAVCLKLAVRAHYIHAAITKIDGQGCPGASRALADG